MEREGTIPKELWPEIAALGFGGLYVSEEAGGSGLSRLDATLVFEALSMACPSVAAFLSIHNMCAKMIDKFGSDEMKARVLPKAMTMETVLSYCLTEPGSGSDAAALKTRAERTNEGYTLNGTKAFISGGGYSDATGPRVSPPSMSRTAQRASAMAVWRIKWVGAASQRGRCSLIIATFLPLIWSAKRAKVSHMR